VTWTIDTCDNLRYAIDAGSTKIEMASLTGTADLCALIQTPPVRHVVLEIYTARGSESVIAWKCEGGAIVVTRGNGATEPRNWPAGTCVRTVQIIEGLLCQGEDECCLTPADVWGGLTVCPELTLDLSLAHNPTLCLTPTGVAAGSYCGGRMVVNAYGQITYLSRDFPAACLPVFDPCGCADTGGGGGSGGGLLDAGDISSASYTGACVLSPGTVQTALNSLDAAICALQSGATGYVTAVNGGAGVVTTIGPTPTVSLETLSAGFTVAGLIVDPYGRVLSYTPPASAERDVIGASPVSASLNVDGDWVVSVGAASSSTAGIVRLASPGDFVAAIPIPPDRVIDWSFLQQWWTTTQGYVCSFVPTPLPARAQRSQAALSACVSGAPGAVNLTETLDYAGAPFARCVVSSAGAITASDNVLSVAPITDGFAVSLATAAPQPFHVSATVYGALALPLITITSASTFELKWRTPADTPVAGVGWSVVVTLGGV
jgi:hypothetical protein